MAEPTASETAASEAGAFDRLPFEEKLAAEKEYLENTYPGVPFVIFRKKEMRDDPKSRGRVKEVEIPFPFLLNGCHGDVETIARFERRGWPIIAYGNLQDPDKEIDKKLKEVAAHVKAREAYMGMSAPVESGILKKKAERGAKSDA